MDLGEHRPAILDALRAGCALAGRAHLDEGEAERLTLRALAEYERGEADADRWEAARIERKVKAAKVRKQLADVQAAWLELVEPGDPLGGELVAPGAVEFLDRLARETPVAPPKQRVRRFTWWMAAAYFRATGRKPAVTHDVIRRFDDDGEELKDTSGPARGPFVDFVRAAAPLARLNPPSGETIATHLTLIGRSYRRDGVESDWLGDLSQALSARLSGAEVFGPALRELGLISEDGR